MTWADAFNNVGISATISSVIMFMVFCISDCSKHENADNAKNRAIQLEIQKIEAAKPKPLTEKDFKIVPVNPEVKD